MKDFTNQKFGDYIITRYMGKQTWEAQCEKCGLVRTYKTQSIRIGEEGKGVCTCSSSGIKIGDRFGRLVIKYRDISKAGSGRVCWVCECDCGNIISIAGKPLKSGNTRSCGCLNNETRSNRIREWNDNHVVDITGERNGLLVAIRKATEEETIGRPKGKGYWYCQCDCGNVHIVGLSDFKMGKVSSCGCLNSKGEAKIASILTENGVNFIKQFTFEDLIGNMGRHYAFDFAIFDNNTLSYLIEYDGVQHFSARQQFSKDESTLEIIQNRDNTKNEYALSHNIPLIRIPYTQFNNLSIEDLQIQTTKFLLQKESDE